MHCSRPGSKTGKDGRELKGLICGDPGSKTGKRPSVLCAKRYRGPLVFAGGGSFGSGRSAQKEKTDPAIITGKRMREDRGQIVENRSYKCLHRRLSWCTIYVNG